MTELAAPADLATYRAGDADLLVAAAEGAVRAYCGWHIAPARTVTVTLDVDPGRALLLPSLYVTAVTQVRDATTTPPEVIEAWWSYPTARFTAGILTRPGGWGCGVVEVDLTHGYPTVPPAVRAVVLDVATLMATSTGGARRQTAGPFSVEGAANQAFTDLHRMVLAPYRLPHVT